MKKYFDHFISSFLFIVLPLFFYEGLAFSAGPALLNLKAIDAPFLPQVGGKMNSRGDIVFFGDAGNVLKVYLAKSGGQVTELFPGNHGDIQISREPIPPNDDYATSLAFAGDSTVVAIGRRSSDSTARRLFAINIDSDNGAFYEKLVPIGNEPQARLWQLAANQNGTIAYTITQGPAVAFKGAFNGSSFTEFTPIELPSSEQYFVDRYTMQMDALGDLYFRASFLDEASQSREEIFSLNRGVIFRSAYQTTAGHTTFRVGLPGVIYLFYPGDAQNQAVNAGIYRIDTRVDSSNFARAFKYASKSTYFLAENKFQVASDFSTGAESLHFDATEKGSILRRGIYLGQKPSSSLLREGDFVTLDRDPTPRKVLEFYQVALSATGEAALGIHLEGLDGFRFVRTRGGGCDASTGVEYLNQAVNFPAWPEYFRKGEDPKFNFTNTGCAVTSAMMLLSKFIPEPYTPATRVTEFLNMREYAWVEKNGLLDRDNNFTWSGLARYFNSNLALRYPSYQGGPLDFSTFYSDEGVEAMDYQKKLNLVKNYVCNDVPLILRVPGASSPKHFVLAVGTTFNSSGQELIKIMDPGARNRKEIGLGDKDKIRGFRAYRNSSTFGSLPPQRVIAITVTGDVVVSINSPLRAKKFDGPYGPFIDNDDSKESIGGEIGPEDIVKNFYYQSPETGPYEIRVQANRDTPYSISVKNMDEEGKTALQSFSSGKLISGQHVQKPFDILATSPFLGTLATDVTFKHNNAVLNTDFIDYNGTLQAASNSDGRNLVTEGVEIISTDAGVELSLAGSAFQRISGGYQYKVDSPVTNFRLVRIMDNGTFRVRLSNIDLTGVGRENFSNLHIRIGNDSFEGSPPRAPVASIAVPKSGLVGESITYSGVESFDLDGNQLTHSWSLVSKPLGSQAVLGSPLAPSALITPDLPGFYVAKLVVSDGTFTSVPVLATYHALSESEAPVPPSADNGFVRLVSDKAEYLLGEAANLQLSIQVPVIGGENEYYFAANLNETGIQLTKLNNTTFAYTTPALSSVGSQAFRVSVYLQNKAQALQLTAAIAFYQAEIVKIDSELARETSATKRAELEAAKQSFQAQISKANEELTRNRTKVAEDALLTFQVHSARN